MAYLCRSFKPTMRFYYLLLIACCIHASSFAQLPSFLTKQGWSMIWNEDDHDMPLEPGYFDQYYRMKKNADGVIPRLPYSNIRKQAEQAVNRDQLLFNVEELGPQNMGGRTRAILIDADDPSHIFAGGISGGLWNSADSGLHWNAVNDYLASISISTITQDHFDHDLIYVGTGEVAGNSADVPGDGVFRSTDHGITFEHLASTDSSAFDFIPKVISSPHDSGWLYICTSNNGLFRSKNKGDSLKNVFITTHAINDIELTPSGAVWIGVNGSGVYYSATGDSGTFVQVTNGLPPNGTFARIEMAIAPSDTMVMYAAFENSGGAYESGLKGFYKSVDGGQSWFAIFSPDADFNFYMSFPWYSMCMGIKPDDPDFIVFGVGDLVYSTDGGTIWKVCHNIHADHHSIVFNPANPTRFYEGNDGGIYRFKTDQLWYINTDLNNGYGTIQYYAGSYFPTGINTYGGAQDNGTTYCKSGGGAFNFIFGGDGAFNAVNQQFPGISYVSYQNGTIHRADDAYLDYPNFFPVMNDMDADGDGAIDDGAWFINPFEINPVNGDQIEFVTRTRVWQTIDGGFTWQPLINVISGTNSPYCLGISNDFSPSVYIGGESGLFFRVDDAYNAVAGTEAHLANSVPSAVTNDFISNIRVHPNDKSICYVSFSNFSEAPRIWKVTNGTSSSPTWTSISGDMPVGLPVNYIEADPAHPDNFLLAGTDFGLYITTDGGQHWVKNNTIPNVVVEQVKVRSGDRRVFIVTHGRGMWTATLDSELVGIEQPANTTFNASVFPNPFQDNLNLRCDEKNMTASVHDVNGRIVFQTKLSSATEQLDLSSLTPGIYFLELTTERALTVRKIIKEN